MTKDQLDTRSHSGVTQMRMRIARRSQLSGITHAMDLPVTREQMEEFNSPDGRLIQEIFPNLTSDQREFILTGITPEEWDEAFGEEADQAPDDEEPAF